MGDSQSPLLDKVHLEHLVEVWKAMPDRRRGVYFVQSGEAGNIKIGLTDDFQERFASLQSAAPEPLYVRAFLNCRDIRLSPQWIEFAMHAKFAAYRVRGEWFRPVQELLDLCARVGTANEVEFKTTIEIMVRYPKNIETGYENKQEEKL